MDSFFPSFCSNTHNFTITFVSRSAEKYHVSTQVLNSSKHATPILLLFRSTLASPEDTIPQLTHLARNELRSTWHDSKGGFIFEFVVLSLSHRLHGVKFNFIVLLVEPTLESAELSPEVLVRLSDFS